MFGNYKYHTGLLIKSSEEKRRERTHPAREPEVLRNGFSEEENGRRERGRALRRACRWAGAPGPALSGTEPVEVRWSVPGSGDRSSLP